MICGWLSRGGRLRLLYESAATALVGDEIRRQHLNRNLAAEPGIAGAVDLAHAPGTEQTENVIGAEPRTRLQGHVRSANYTRRCMPRSAELARSRVPADESRQTYGVRFPADRPPRSAWSDFTAGLGFGRT
jgi:hypothetical protein